MTELEEQKKVIGKYVKKSGLSRDAIKKLFKEASNEFGFEEAKKVIDTENIKKLWNKVNFINNIRDELFYFSSEVSIATIKEYISYLKENKNSLIETGFPKGLIYFPLILNSNKLSVIYPTRKPAYIKKIKNIINQYDEIVYNHKTKNMSKFHDLIKIYEYSINIYDYLNSIPLGKISLGNKKRTKIDRNNLFDLKMDILIEILKFLERDEDIDLWEKCFKLLKIHLSNINAFYYNMLDFYYDKYDIKNKITYGGLSEFIEIIGYYSVFIKSDHISQIRKLLEKHIIQDSWGFPQLDINSYFQVINDSECKKEIKNCLDIYNNEKELSNELWKQYLHRINYSIGKEFYLFKSYKIEIPSSVMYNKKFFSTVDEASYYIYNVDEIIEFTKNTSSIDSLGKDQLSSDDSNIKSEIVNQISSDDLSENVFRCIGVTWEVIYNGIKKSIKHTIGMRYIAFLLRNQGEWIYCTDIIQNNSESDSLPVMSEDSEISKMDNKTLQDQLSLKNITKTGESIDSIDPQAKEEYRKELLRIERKLKKEKDKEKLKILLHNKKILVKNLTQSVKPDGDIRKVNDDIERSRKSVQKAITIAIKNISKEHKSLGKHLNSIKTGNKCSYKPENPINWQLK